MSEPEVSLIVKHMLTGLKFIHSKNVIHRDLQLSNFFIDDDFKIRIGGFDYAALLKSSKERRYSLGGAPLFMAPEII